MPENLKAGLETLVKQAPTMTVFLVLVGLFLFYQERQASREDLTAKTRIERCHQVQAESSEAIKKLTEAMQSQALAFKEMSLRLERLEESR